ncbi:MAG: ferritin-like domain-containing protein [Candidatus Electrothrix sp. GW3-4]|uniref:ferritin-like domain-containing protein n=1 Tax=Candidatus Electrothrix sp. GW3-4 TaxID=3126740 RepID=UPI0030CF00CC
MNASGTAKKWTKELVQQHAQVAVAVELYTLPLYITAMGSIKEEHCEAVQIIRSVIIEEILHLQLAANLCLALDTSPNFSPPQYGSDIPYLCPYNPETGECGFLNATLGPLDDTTLDTMLDIETPEQAQLRQDVDHTQPKYPYHSIGEMYDALIIGINRVGIKQFSWQTNHQQRHWGKQNFCQIIDSYSKAQDAVQAIINQGEGHIFSEDIAPPPWTEKDFPVPPYYRFEPYPEAPNPYNGYSHFGRFIKIKNNGLPDIYSGTEQPDHPINKPLQKNFLQLILMLETLWRDGGVHIGGADALRTVITKVMQEIFANTQACWQAGVIPHWFDLPLGDVQQKSV